MAQMITENCISCGACLPECPTKAISEGAQRFDIDPARCVECVGYFSAMQCADVCPVDACVADPGHNESEAVLLERARALDTALSVPEGAVPSHLRS